MTSVSRDVPYRKLVTSDDFEVDEDNPLPVLTAGPHSDRDPSINLDTVTLDPAEEFLSGWVETLDYVQISAIISADETSAANGVQVEWSDDQSTVIRQLTTTILGANQGGKPIYVTLPTQGQYFRVRYQNGASTAVVDMHILLRKFDAGTAQAPLAQTLDAFNTAQLVRAILAGRLDDGSFENLSIDNDAFLRINIAGQEQDVQLEALSTLDINQSPVSTSSASQLPPVPITGRKSVAFKNLDTRRNIFISDNAAPNSSNGFHLDPRETIILELDETVRPYFIAETGDATDRAVVFPVLTFSVGTGTFDAGNLKAVDGKAATISTSATTSDGFDVDVFKTPRVLDTVEEVVLTVVAAKGQSGGTDPQIDVSYEVDGTPGASSTTFTLDSEDAQTFTLDITADESPWTFEKVDAVKIIIRAANSVNRESKIDGVYLDVTEGVSDDDIRVAWVEVA